LPTSMSRGLNGLSSRFLPCLVCVVRREGESGRLGEVELSELGCDLVGRQLPGREEPFRRHERVGHDCRYYLCVCEISAIEERRTRWMDSSSVTASCCRFGICVES
jgi:hypothetical protein